MTSKSARFGAKWTDKEHNEIVELVKNSKIISRNKILEISNKFGRTHGSIMSRCITVGTTMILNKEKTIKDIKNLLRIDEDDIYREKARIISREKKFKLKEKKLEVSNFIENEKNLEKLMTIVSNIEIFEFFIENFEKFEQIINKID